MSTRSENSRWKWWWEEWIKPVLVAAVLALFIRTFIVQPFKIPTTSMYPTLKPGDRIFVNKFIYGARVPFTDIRFPELRPPKPGDIVVFLSTREEKKYLIKRYIAGAGDRVRIDEGRLYLNGELLRKSPFMRFFYYKKGKYIPDQGEAIKVPEGHFFVLGDNSANSLDSRYWGFVPYENLVGRAFLIHWPVRRIQLLQKGD